MTVITTLITKHYCVLASDSRLSAPNKPRDQWPPDEPKLIPVPRWRGAMAYWGLASQGNTWNTKHFLIDRIASAPNDQSAEDFAHEIADRLNGEFVARGLANHGLGVHFTAYERDDIDETIWIPELFVITNWKYTPENHYSSIKGYHGFEVTRESYQGLCRQESVDPNWSLDERRRPDNRRALYRALHETDLVLYFNNGDPKFFNPIAETFFHRFDARAILAHSRVRGVEESHRVYARGPIELVSMILEQMEPDRQVIGGITHDLTIAPDGTIHAHCSLCGELARSTEKNIAQRRQADDGDA